MSDSKKYYYMRLVENYFDRDELAIIRKMPKGAEYLLILLKMSCKSFKNDGFLMITKNMPYSPETLAASIGEDVNDVRAAFGILSEFNLIEIFETKEIYINDIDNFIGHSSNDADRKRRVRKQKNVINGQIEDKTGTYGGQMSASGQTSTRDRVITRDRAYNLDNRERDKEKINTGEKKSFSSFPTPPDFSNSEPVQEFQPDPGKLYDSTADYWNKKGNLPKALSSLNNSDAKKLCDVISDYGQDYVNKAIDNYSDNLDSIENKFRVGSITKFLFNSVGKWAEYEDVKTSEFFNDLDKSMKTIYMRLSMERDCYPKSIEQLNEWIKEEKQKDDIEIEERA